MGSPFDGFANTTLLFPVPTGEVTQDEVGNAISETTNVRVTATLKATTIRNADANRRSSSVDEGAMLLEGYCIAPSILPASVLPNNWADANWGGSPGYFYLTEPINPPYGRDGIGAIVEQSAGTKIVGWFQTSRSEYA